jgi:Sulfotransferase domain
MATSLSSSPSSSTRRATDLKKQRFGMSVLAAMIITSFNYICVSKFWVADQISLSAEASKNAGLLFMREDKNRRTEQTPFVLGTHDIEETVEGQMENRDAVKDEKKPRSSPEWKGLAELWPTKQMSEAICDEIELGSLRVPSFIIPGTQKAGTSALFALLSMHPQVVSSRKFEVHFFDYKLKEYKGKDPESVSDEDICEQRRAYQHHSDFQLMNVTENGTKIATFEKTPRYLCYSYIPAYVKRIVPWTKILIILRNPVDRAYSHWKMDASRFADDTDFPSFEDSVSLTINRLKEIGMSKAPTLEQFRDNHYTEEAFELPANQTLMRRKTDGVGGEKFMTQYIPRGFYAQQIIPWMDHFKYGKDLKIIKYEKLQQDLPRVFRDILNFIDVDPDAWAMDDEVFKRDFRPVSVKIQKSHQKLDNTTRAYLEKFFKPYNDQLAVLLGEEFRD